MGRRVPVLRATARCTQRRSESPQGGPDGKMIMEQKVRCLKGNTVTERANRRISNRQIPELESYLTSAISVAKPFLIAKLCDFRRSHFSTSTVAPSMNSNRRKAASFAFRQNSSPLATRRRSCYSESAILPQHLTVLPEQTERLARRFQFAPRFLLVRRLRRNFHGYRSNPQGL
jgi:hypothetical protein